MEDAKIVALYWNRDEAALKETSDKYGVYCYAIAYHILNNHHEAEECVNDTFLGAWNSIPPNRPATLAAYLGKITWRLSLKVLRSKDTDKRGNGEMAASLDELREYIPSQETVEANIEYKELVSILCNFLAALPTDEKQVFVQRYWHACSISEICKQHGFSKSKVESMLFRTRKKLKKVLEKEGYCL